MIRFLFLSVAILAFANAYSQTYLPLQDFSTASGITPPAGWINTSVGVNPVADRQFPNTTKPTCLPTDLVGDGAAFPYAVIGNSFYSDAMNTQLATTTFSTLNPTHASLGFSELSRSQSGVKASIDYSLDGGTTWMLLAARKDQYIIESDPNAAGCVHTLVPLPAAA